jgi:hypothetical protein
VIPIIQQGAAQLDYSAIRVHLDHLINDGREIMFPEQFQQEPSNNGVEGNVLAVWVLPSTNLCISPTILLAVLSIALSALANAASDFVILGSRSIVSPGG